MHSWCIPPLTWLLRVPFWALTFVWPRLAYESFMASRLDGYASGNLQGSADNRPPVSPGERLAFCMLLPSFFCREIGKRGVREHCQFFCWMILGAFRVSSGRAEDFFNLWMISLEGVFFRVYRACIHVQASIWNISLANKNNENMPQWQILLMLRGLESSRWRQVLNISKSYFHTQCFQIQTHSCSSPGSGSLLHLKADDSLG